MRSSVQRNAGRHTHGRLSGGSRARRRTTAAALGAAAVVVAAVVAAVTGAGSRPGESLTAAAMTTQTTTVLDKIVTKSGALYDGVTGKAFTPRGVDYVRLAK